MRASFFLASLLLVSGQAFPQTNAIVIKRVGSYSHFISPVVISTDSMNEAFEKKFLSLFKNRLTIRRKLVRFIKADDENINDIKRSINGVIPLVVDSCTVYPAGSHLLEISFIKEGQLKKRYHTNNINESLRFFDLVMNKINCREIPDCQRWIKAVELFNRELRAHY